VAAALVEEMVRAEVDDSNETFNKKVRNNTVLRLPILLIVGEREELENTVTVRRYKINQQRTLPLDTFRNMVLEEIKRRDHVTTW